MVTCIMNYPVHENSLLNPRQKSHIPESAKINFLQSRASTSCCAGGTNLGHNSVGSQACHKILLSLFGRYLLSISKVLWSRIQVLARHPVRYRDGKPSHVSGQTILSASQLRCFGTSLVLSFRTKRDVGASCSTRKPGQLHPT